MSFIPKFRILERIRFRMSGRAVPAVRVSDIDRDGKIHTIRYLGQIKKRDNSLVSTWDAKAWEIAPGTGGVTLINEKDISEFGYVVSESGSAVNLYTKPFSGTNTESIAGKFATADDIADNMDLQKSFRYVLIGALLSAPVWWVLFIVINRAMS